MSFSTSLAAGAAANQWNLNCPGSINYPYLRKKSVNALPMLSGGDGHRLSMFDGYRCPVPVICQSSAKTKGGERNSSQTRPTPQDRPKKHVILTTERTQEKMDFLEKVCTTGIGLHGNQNRKKDVPSIGYTHSVVHPYLGEELDARRALS